MEDISDDMKMPHRFSRKEGKYRLESRWTVMLKNVGIGGFLLRWFGSSRASLSPNRKEIVVLSFLKIGAVKGL